MSTFKRTLDHSQKRDCRLLDNIIVLLKMGNIGGPSKGCNRCKRLKVKACAPDMYPPRVNVILIHSQCDEAKPQCLRCERAKQKCTGYVDTETFDARVRYETGLGNRRVTRSRRSKQKSPDPVVAPPEKSAPPKKVAVKKDESLLEAAVLLFKTAHVASYDSVYFSWDSTSDDCLERCIAIMNESDEDSSLKHAMSAVYNGFYSFTSKSKEMEEAAEASFAAAVSLARAALDDPVESKSDATLLTVLLLSMFEVGSYPWKSGQMNWIILIVCRTSAVSKILDHRQRLIGSVLRSYYNIEDRSYWIVASLYSVSINSTSDLYGSLCNSLKWNLLIYSF